MSESKIRKAITATAKAVKRVSKENRNVEQKYDFASVDDFLAMTGPIMAENGLFITMDEDEIETFERQGKYGPVFWLKIRFVLTVCHDDGEELKPVKRTVEVIRTGAQSFGSAQSYVLKQFQRALFNIATGDKDDADFAEKGEGRPSDAPSAGDRFLSDLRTKVANCTDNACLDQLYADEKTLAGQVLDSPDPFIEILKSRRAEIAAASKPTPVADEESPFGDSND